jgi:hypothetical protein
MNWTGDIIDIDHTETTDNGETSAEEGDGKKQEEVRPGPYRSANLCV